MYILGAISNKIEQVTNAIRISTNMCRKVWKVWKKGLCEKWPEIEDYEYDFYGLEHMKITEC